MQTPPVGQTLLDADPLGGPPGCWPPGRPPGRADPLGCRSPLGRLLPPVGQTPLPGYVNKRAVRILLECILVFECEYGGYISNLPHSYTLRGAIKHFSRLWRWIFVLFVVIFDANISLCYQKIPIFMEKNKAWVVTWMSKICGYCPNISYIRVFLKQTKLAIMAIMAL